MQARPAEPVALASLTGTCCPERKAFILALKLGSNDEQQSLQISLSKLIMSPTHCRVPDDPLGCLEIEF
jgi:hypothetical protein